MKKHGVIIDMTNNFLALYPSHYTYIRATSSTTLSPLSSPTERVAIMIKKDITPQKITKKGSTEDMTDFLQTPNKLSNKKRREINQSKQKTSIGETSLRKAIMSNLDSLDKIELPVSIGYHKYQNSRLMILI